MLGTTHIIYMLISLALSAAVLTLLYFRAKEERQRTIALRFFAIITVVIHFSSLWVDYFSDGTATVESSMLLPIHPCNVCMWLLLICSFIKKRESIIYKLISEFTFLGGTVCGTIGILLNENFANNPTLLDYGVLKGLLSHSTMVLGCIYLLVGGFVKIRVSAVISTAAGLTLFIVDGAIINALYEIFGLAPCNSMYLLEAPFPALPWLGTVTIGVMALAVAFIITAAYEQLALKKEDRWYSVLREKIKEGKGEG